MWNRILACILWRTASKKQMDRKVADQVAGALLILDRRYIYTYNNNSELLTRIKRGDGTVGKGHVVYLDVRA